MKFYQKKYYLEEEYVNKRRSIRDIADDCGVSHPTIHRHLRLLGVPIRSRIESISKVKKPKKELTAEELEGRKRDLLKRQLKLAEEVKELGDSLKYPLSRAQAQQNRRIEAGKREKLELKKRRGQLEADNVREGGAWAFGDARDQMGDFEDEFHKPADTKFKRIVE